MEETAQLTHEAVHEWGKLLFLGKDGQPAEQYTISKSTVVLGRDKNCDIVIPRREVSRQHAQLAVDDSGAVWLSSMGKEPICVNGQPAHDAVELYTGDQIEILLEGRTKVICFEAAQEDTIKINKNPSTGRIPLGEADTNTADCKGRGGALAAPAVAQKTPKSAARPPPVARSAAPPPAPPPMPAKGSLFAGNGAAANASAKAAPLKPPPAPPVPGLRILAPPDKPVAVPTQKEPVETQKQAKPVQAPAPGTFLPSAVDLQALRAGLRKTNPGSTAGAAKEAPAPADAAAPEAPPDAKAAAKKRKSVRFNIPPEDPASPEGVAADATLHWGAAVPQSPDVIINVSADNTAAFSAWAMGTSRCSIGDLTGDGLGLPSIQEETGSEDCASPEEDVCMQQVTPSRQITPAIRRRSSHVSSVISAKSGSALPASPDSVGRKRRSCSGSRNGTPAVRDRRSASVDPDTVAMMAEETILEASLAAAEAAAAHAENQDGDVTLDLAAAAQKLEAMVTDLPEEDDVAATPPPMADRAPADMGTPWTKEIEHEATAFAKLLAAASRSVTPSSPQGTPQKTNTPSRARAPASGRKSRFSLAAAIAEGANTAQAEEPATQPHAPANTPISALEAHSGADVGLAGPSPIEMAEAAVEHMTSDQQHSANVNATGGGEHDDVDIALDSALEAFPEEELVRRDQVFSLMTNFKAALARARQAEDRATELEGLLGKAEKLIKALQSKNADLRSQLDARQINDAAPASTQPTDLAATEAAVDTATVPESAALLLAEALPQDAAAPPAVSAPPDAMADTPSKAMALPQDAATPALKAPAVSARLEVEPLAQDATAPNAAEAAEETAEQPLMSKALPEDRAVAAAGSGPPRSTEYLLALAGCLERAAPTWRSSSDAGLLHGSPAAEPQAGAARHASESGAPRSSVRLPLAARTCLLRAQDALLASLPVQPDGSAVLACADAIDGPSERAQSTGSPPEQDASPANTAVGMLPETAAVAGMVEDPTLPSLPFEGLSQRLSLDTREWMEGLLMKTGSQDISPPKETAQPGLPDEAPNDIDSKDALPQEVETAAETFAPMQLEEAAPAPADKAMDTTEDAAPHHIAMLAHPLDVGSPAAVVLEASQDPTDHPSHAAVDTEMPDVAKAIEEAADDTSEAGEPDVALKKAPLSATDESASPEEPDLAGETAPVQEQAGEVAFTEADAEEDEDDEDRCCVCDEADEGDVLLLCDGCNAAFHLQCTKPRLRKIPPGDWHCHECRAAIKAAAQAHKPATSTEAVLSEPELEPKTAAKPARRGARSGSEPQERTAEEATVSKRMTRRNSMAPAAAEAPAPGAVSTARAARRRQSIVPEQTPAAAAAPAGGAALKTAVSMRGRRRRSSVSPAPDCVPREDEGRQARGARRVPAHMTSITQMSLGPPQGSLGVIREEGSEEAGSDADEGESAPQAESSKAAREAPSKGRKRGRTAAKKEQDSPAKPAEQTRASKEPAAKLPQTRRSTRTTKRT